MSFKKIVSMLCVIALIVATVPAVTFATEITALDLSENRTRFYSVGETGTLIVYGLSGSETERVREGIINNSLLTFSTSNAGVVDVNDDGSYSIVGEGIAIITADYDSITGSMVCYVETSENLYAVNDSISSSLVDKTTDAFRGKSDVYRIKSMLTPALTNTTYVMGGWFYDSTDTSDASLVYKFGPRAATQARPLWGAYLNTWSYMAATVMGCSDYVNTVTVTKNSRIKGWHQFFVIIQRVDSTTHYMTFFDGELVLKGTTSSEVAPYFIDQMTTLCQEVYIAPYSAASSFDVSSISVSNGDTDVAVDTDIKVVFNRALDSSSDLSAVLKDTVNNQDIELDVTVEGNTFTAKPLYDLAHNNGYKLILSGSAVSVEDIFIPSASVDIAEEIIFTTEKAEIYAENLSISHTDAVSFSADIVNNGSETDVWLITAQYDNRGVQKHIAVEKTEDAQSGPATPIVNVPANQTAALSEGYVWTGLDSLEAASLSAPAVSGTYTRDSADAGTQISTYADVGYSPDNGLVEVHGYTSTKRGGLPVLVRVIRPGKNYTTVTKDNVNDIYARVEQIYTTAGGRFDYKFELDGDPGLYKVIVNIPFASAIEDEINFASLEDVQAYMGYLQNPETHPETTDPAEIFEEARLVLDMNYTKFDTLAYKNIVYSMLDAAEDFDTFRPFADFFAEAVDVVSALETNDKDVIEANKTKWGIGNLSVYEIYDEMTSEEAANIHSAILAAGFSDYETLSDKFAEVIILKELKTVDNYSEIYPLLQAASDCFVNDVPTLDFTGYGNLSETEQGTAMKALARKLSDITSKADIITEFNIAVSDADDGEGGGGSSGGGSPSYSGGFSGGSGNDKTDVITGKFEAEQETVMGSQTPEWVEHEKELSQRKVFDDLDTVPWAEDAIRELYNRGIISGKSERIFAPNDYLTREELAKMLIGAMNLQVGNSQPCNLWDVNRNAWYAPYADTAVEKGLIQGAGNGSFGIGALVNREEICTIADRAAQVGGIYLDDEFTIRPFFDEKQISSWALYSVNKMRESFVITGVGGNWFDPKTPVTRAQAAKIIYGVLAYAGI